MSFPDLHMDRAGERELGGVPRGSEAFILARLMQQRTEDLIYIAASDREVEAVRNGLAFFAPRFDVVLLPAWDCLPYDRASPNAGILAERIMALSALTAPASAPRIVLTTINAALQKLPPRDVIAKARFTLTAGKALSYDALTHFLAENGYRRTSTAIEAGEFAVRGSIIDIIASGDAGGFRLDTFGDTLESIRTLDPVTQRSADKVEEVILRPASEVILNEATSAQFREGYRAAFGASHNDPLYEAISDGRTHAGMEHLLPLFYSRLESLFDYLPNAAVIFAHQTLLAYKERFELVAEYHAARTTGPGAKQGTVYRALPPDALYLTGTAWQQALDTRACITLSPFIPEDKQASAAYRQGRNFASAKLAGEALWDALTFHVSGLRERQKATFVACYSQGGRERIAAMLSEHGLHPFRVESADEIRDVKGNAVGLAVLGLENGFEAEYFAVISEQDLFGERILRTRPKRKKSENVMMLASNFVPGELVVHREHGIGRFEGLVTLEVQGAQHDCLKLIYDGEAKLFLPVENIDVVSRYGTEDENAKLDKLGSASWQSRKAKLKERITLAADELIRTAAARALQTADAFPLPQGLYEEFCARFPYHETDDQARAIEDVLGDIASGRPTDRLVCGDVGFGKTEVALRAAFVAACAQTERGPVQVAIVCPTTLLCRQHFHTFRERFEGLPFTVRQLSRLTTAADKKDTLAGLKEGRVNIVVGTHALLGKSVEFNNLRLLIIDEEQHFGVAQKEKLKSLRADIHVLTLSATPIPRTLQMALSGMRELSIIATPPVDRLAVRTFVTPHDPVTLREAILREHHRGGKVFYVTPRIEHMAEIRHMLLALVPEIRIIDAHGQMAPGELDKRMNAFYDGKYDLLLSTSIVESGLDVPTANTIIVDRAHMFGLSQLYQLRGRVGRSKTRAYAYYTLPHRKQLSRAATRRLEVMQTLDSLGAGFTLASHDMDIRGFGNLLGEEQSGHVREVGIELYQQMLEEAVNAAKSRKSGEVSVASDDWSPSINLGMTVLIPEAYVQDLELRLGLYRRAASLVTEEEIHAFAAECIDRFGPLPEEVEHLLAIVRLKQLCREAGVERVDAGPKGAVLSFRENRFAQPEKLLAYIGKNARTAKLRPDQKLVLMREWTDPKAKLKDVKDSITDIAKLVA